MKSLHRVLQFAGIAIVVLVGTESCGLFGGSDSGKQTMLTGASTPAGQGTVEATKGDNGNTMVDVRVKHLAPPAKLADDASVYVVWIQPKHGDIQNAGALVVDSDLDGRLKTTTPHSAFTVTVTPEPSPRMARPTHDAVFSSEVSRTD